MDDSKLKEPGSPDWPAKQLRGMRLPSVYLNDKRQSASALKIYQECINHEATTAARTRKMNDANTKKKILLKIGGQGATSNSNRTWGA